MNTSSNDKNQFYKTSIIDGMTTPYPPDPPAFCTRQSVKQMKETSEELTKNELQKIKEKTIPPPLKQEKPITCASSVDFNPDMHRIMCKYADKQQQLCAQICDLNTRLQNKQDAYLLLKDEHLKTVSDLKDELEHIQEINEGNEDELNECNERLDELQTTFLEYREKNENAWAYQPICVLFVLFVYTMICLELNKHFAFGPQQLYNEYTSSIGEWMMY